MYELVRLKIWYWECVVINQIIEHNVYESLVTKYDKPSYYAIPISTKSLENSKCT